LRAYFYSLGDITYTCTIQPDKNGGHGSISWNAVPYSGKSNKLTLYSGFPWGKIEQDIINAGKDGALLRLWEGNDKIPGLS
jgi:hypothetical protein